MPPGYVAVNLERTDEYSSILVIRDRTQPMTSPAHPSDFPGYHGRAATSPDSVRAKPGILRRILDAIGAASERQSEREIARFIARRGARITDEVEREIGRRVMTSNWGIRE